MVRWSVFLSSLFKLNKRKQNYWQHNSETSSFTQFTEDVRNHRMLIEFHMLIVLWWSVCLLRAQLYYIYKISCTECLVTNTMYIKLVQRQWWKSILQVSLTEEYCWYANNNHMNECNDVNYNMTINDLKILNSYIFEYIYQTQKMQKGRCLTLYCVCFTRFFLEWGYRSIQLPHEHGINPHDPNCLLCTITEKSKNLLICTLKK